MDDCNETVAASSPTPDNGGANGQQTDPTTGTQWCSTCQKSVLPIGEGQCPDCKRATPKNTMARRRRVNVARRNQRLAKIKIDHQIDESSVIRMVWAETLANTLEEMLSPRSTMDLQRHVELSEKLYFLLSSPESSGSRPNANQSPVEEAAAAFAALSEDEQIERIGVLYEQAKADREARKAREAAAVDVTAANHETAAPLKKRKSEPPSTPTPCPYCRKSPCVGREDPLFFDFHHDDPTVIAERDERATREMFRQAGKPLPPYFK